MRIGVQIQHLNTLIRDFKAEINFLRAENSSNVESIEKLLNQLVKKREKLFGRLPKKPGQKPRPKKKPEPEKRSEPKHVNGDVVPIAQFAKERGLNFRTLYTRIYMGELPQGVVIQQGSRWFVSQIGYDKWERENGA